ncbi:sigma-54 dependent transcriptional regulator [Myxococcota bacterium]|nr:sigma-54 dependent transcriptional regulator [Myxococcota bacterium]
MRQSGSELLMGSSERMAKLRADVARVAASDCPVLVTGPTGSGKELVVRAIHAASRPGEPLREVDCGAIPGSLMESELFGHQKGAFTGANEDKAGLFRAVGRGTLFLDEIAELELPLQAKLLRVLECRRFRAVGALDDQPLAGRIVAATHANLEARVAERLFRQDLLYRLKVLVVHVPALDEHREDIPELVAHFLAQQPRKLTLTREAMALLVSRRWPGNVRELRSVVHRLVVYADGAEVGPELVHLALDESPPCPCAPPNVPLTDDELVDRLLEMPGADKLDLVERLLIERAMVRAGGNQSAAARLLGVHRKVVERRIRGHCAPSSAPDGRHPPLPYVVPVSTPPGPLTDDRAA